MSQHLSEQNFQVIVRIRPLNPRQQQQIQSYESAQTKKFKTPSSSSSNKPLKLSPMAYAFYTKFYNVQSLGDIMKVQNQNTINVIDTEYKNLSSQMKSYTFSQVYSNKQTSEEIFQKQISSQIQCILEGYNYTILAYGITGSGKTHTVFGSNSFEKHHKGISGLALNFLLKKKKQLQHDKKTKVNLGFSFVQIYNQNVRDLLNTQGKMLNIIQDAKGNTSFTDATQILIHNQDQIHDLINLGLTKRSSGATMANQYSSRSHAILQMNIEIVTETTTITSKMFIIDLAGSEKIQTLNCAKKVQQGANINRSLLALGNCINILAENSRKNITISQQKSHIPYRDSKLTRILKDSLGGNAKTLMISCISENPFTIQETITTLNYAQRAQGIKKEIKRNKYNSADQLNGHVLCSNCHKQINGYDGQIHHTNNGSSSCKIILPSHLTFSESSTKDQLLETFFCQIYQDIQENIKQKYSIQKILSSNNNNKNNSKTEGPSTQQIQKLYSVNQSQGIQLKQTMWKLFAQKQQDYTQKITQLNEFIQRYNNDQLIQKQNTNNKSNNSSRVVKSRIATKRQQSRQENQQNIVLGNSDLWNVPPPNSKRNNSSSEKTQKVRSISLSRKPLQMLPVNQEEQEDGGRYMYNNSNSKCDKKNQPLLFPQQEHQNNQNNGRFSFASLLVTNTNMNRNEPSQQSQRQITDQAMINQQKSSQKLTQRKRSRSKFQVVRRMSNSKVQTKEFNAQMMMNEGLDDSSIKIKK